MVSETFLFKVCIFAIIALLFAVYHIVPLIERLDIFTTVGKRMRMPPHPILIMIDPINLWRSIVAFWIQSMVVLGSQQFEIVAIAGG